MEDKGSVNRIKFSPNMAILAVTRNGRSSIDFLNFKNGQPSFPEYSVNLKAKNTKSKDFYWLDTNEIMLVSEQGFEHYQMFPDKRALKLLKYYNMSLNWLIWSQEAQIFIISTGTHGSILNPFVYDKGSFVKLPKFEVDLPLPLNYKYSGGGGGGGSISSNDSQSSLTSINRLFLNESDVVLGHIYDDYYLFVIRQMSIPKVVDTTNSNPRRRNNNTRSGPSGYSEIAMYKLVLNSPAKKTNILKVHLSGRFILNIIDELIVIHHRLSYSSMIFDIRMKGEFDGYTTCNYPIIEKAFIEPTDLVLPPNDQLEKSSKMTESTTSSSSLTAHSEMYSTNWFMFLPNIVIDTRIGCFWYMSLNLNNNSNLSQYRELFDDPLKLVDFLLNRRKTKANILRLCEIMIRKKTSLEIIQKIFDKINLFYRSTLPIIQQHKNNINNRTNSNIPSATASASDELKTLADELPAITQYDIHNQILYPLLEDETWWTQNVTYTIAIIVEYFHSLADQGIPIEQFLYSILVNALIKANRLYQLHQYLQYHVLSDSKSLACLLISIQDRYPAANQLALDMLKRLGTANEEIIDVLLSNGLTLSALRYANQLGCNDTLKADKFLEISKEHNDPRIFYEVFRHFEARNVRLYGSPVFRPEEEYARYVKHFTNLFQQVKLKDSNIKTGED
jgi:regulator of MON1-CCZ1 complex